VQQVVEGDRRPLVVAPRRHVRRGVDVEAPVADEQPDQGVGERLRHRPRQQLRGVLHRLRRPIPVLQRPAVALGEQATALDDDHGVRRAERATAEHLVEQRLDVDARRDVATRPLVGGPRHGGGLGRERHERVHGAHRCCNCDLVRRLRRAPAIALLTLLPLLACGDDGDSTEAFCDRAETFDQEFEEIEAEFESNELPTPEVFADGADAIEKLAEGAPDEVEDDLRTIIDGFDEIAAALDEVDLTDPAGTGVVEAAGRMQTVAEDIEGAVGRVEEFLQAECGISMSE
jgi:hypothetical protein